MSLAKISSLLSNNPEMEAKLRANLEETLEQEGIQATASEIAAIRALLSKVDSLVDFVKLENLPSFPVGEWNSPLTIFPKPQ